MKEPKMPAEKSWAIIEEAMSHVREEKTNAHFFYILWGALLTAFYVIQYLSAVWAGAPVHLLHTLAYLVFPIGGLWSFVYSKKMDKEETVRLFSEKVYLYTWGGVALCLGLSGMFHVSQQMNNFTFLTVLLFGLAAFITGGVARFKPSLIGGVLAIICAFITIHMSAANQYLFAALGVLLSCFLPGLLMRSPKVKHV